MSECFVGEIRMFAGDFAPRSWSLCDGQLVAVSQNDALFSLLGTIYGGDGRTTFGLPDMRGRVPLHYGSGPGLTPRPLGAKAGSETALVDNANMLPSHSHALRATTTTASSRDPAGNLLAVSSAAVYTNGTADTSMLPTPVTGGPAGNQTHDNVQPFLCVNFIICLFGVFPSRT